jgi:hypothetical protein
VGKNQITLPINIVVFDWNHPFQASPFEICVTCRVFVGLTGVLGGISMVPRQA